MLYVLNIANPMEMQLIILSEICRINLMNTIKSSFITFQTLL